MTDAKPHEVTYIVSPVSETARCSCGWHHVESRRQNARARTAKIKSAVGKHRKSVDAR